MGCVMVTVYLSGVSVKQREIIYTSLMERNWMKLTEPGDGTDTVWYCFFDNAISEAASKETAANDFKNCTRGCCRPKLAIHWGPNQPLFMGL